MAQETLLQILEKGKEFKLFLDTIFTLNSSSIVWKRFFAWDYTPTLTYQAYVANAKVAAAASVINFGAGKPIRTRPTVGQLNGTLGTLGDIFQMDALSMRKFMELEELLNKQGGDLKRLYDYLVPDFQAAVIAPHKRLDIWALQGASTGKITVDTDNNPEGVQFEIELGISKYSQQGAQWDMDETGSTPLTDIRHVLDRMKAKGRPLQKMHMTRATFNKMVASNEFKSVFGLNFGKLVVNPVNVVTLDMVNTYFQGVGLPIIELMEYAVELPTGEAINPFSDNRVLFTSSDRWGSMQYTYANEERMKEAGKTYSSVDNVLISYWVANGGRFLGYELNAFPAFEAYQNMAILETDD
jgi:hypothetical protein